MSSTRCPTCRRILALGDHLRGELVRCPMCGTVFDAPAQEEAARVPVPGSPVTQAPGAPSPPPRPAPAADFDPDALRRGPGLTPDDQASLRSAATWLQAAVAFQIIGTILCSCPALFFCLQWAFPRGEMGLLGGLGVLVLWVVVLVVLGAGPRHLRERRDYPLALVSGILALAVALSSAAQTAYLAWQARDALDTPVLAVVVFGVGLGLTCALTALVAGVKTLIALSRPEVKRSFR